MEQCTHCLKLHKKQGMIWKKRYIDGYAYWFRYCRKCVRRLGL